MGRHATAIALALAFSACDDPVFIAGDLPGLMRIVAGEPDAPGFALDSLAIRSHLNAPRGAYVGPDGVLYVADEGNARVLAVSSAGDIETLVDHRTSSDTFRIRRPSAITLDATSDILFSDTEAHRIWRLDAADRVLVSIAGSGERGSSPDGTAADGAALEVPFGIALDRDGKIYFSERGGHRVRAIRADGTLETIAGVGTESFGGDGGPAAQAGLSLPSGIAIARDTLFIVDSGNDRIRMVDLASGTIQTIAGSGLRGFSGDGGPALEAAFNLPEFVTPSSDGRIMFISDTQNHRIRAIDRLVGTISTFAGTGDPGFNGDLRDAGATSLSRPGALAASDFDLLFIADPGHHIVWRVALASSATFSRLQQSNP